MANIINGTSTGAGGLITTGDSSDELQLQTAETARVTLTNTAVVVNEDGNDVDFRVESDTDPNAFFVDGGTGNIGIGTATTVGDAGYKALTIGGNASGETQINFRSNAAQIAQYVVNTSGVTLNYQNLDYLRFFNSAGERMRIDSSGNVGIGVTPTNNTLGKTLQVGQAGAWVAESGTNRWWLGNNWYYNSGDKYINNGFATLYSQQSGAHQWYTAASGTAGNAITFTQAMTLDASGNLLVGTTTLNGDGLSIKPRGSAGFTTQLNFNRASSATNGFPIVFQNGGVDVGYIAHNNTSTSYVTSSDYRLKENVAPMTGALSKVLELNPVTYTWKADGSAGEGFIAHELQEVAPYAVSGEKDGEEMQGVDYGKITPILTAALQEAIAEIQSLKARIEALEAK